MPVIDVLATGDQAWPDIADGRTIHHLTDQPWKLARLERGMASGRTSLALRLDLPDGSTVIAQTSLEAWRLASAALEGFEERATAERAQLEQVFDDDPPAGAAGRVASGLYLVRMCRACFERDHPRSQTRPTYLDPSEPCVRCGGNTRCVYRQDQL